MSLWSDHEDTYKYDDLLARLRRNPSYAPTPRQSRLAEDALGTETRYDPSALEVEIGYIVYGDPTLHAEPDPEPEPFTEEPDTYTDYVRRWARKAVLIQNAQLETAYVRIIAANPWYLHHLAATEAWEAYADAYRR